jgi:hypothetical protein
MLNNEPPPGTPVRFLRDARKAVRGSRGTLVRPLRKYLTESVDDEFEVEIGGERITVKRGDIEEV